MKFNNFRIGSRLGAGFAAVLSLTAAITFAGAWRLGVASDDVTEMMTETLVKERLVEESMRHLQVGMKRAVAVANSSDPSLERVFADESKEASLRGNEILKELDALPRSDEETRLLAHIAETRKPYIATRDAIMKARRTGRFEDVTTLFSERFNLTGREYSDSYLAYLKYQQHAMDELAAKVKNDAATSRQALMLAGAVALLIGTAFAWALSRSVTRPLAHALALAKSVARGDLTQNVEVDGRDEIAGLLKALKEMQSQLSQLVSQVRGGVDSVQVASSEIARGNLDLSQRTERTAASLQETASSLEQLTGTVRQTADSAQIAGRLVASASSVAEEGGSVVAQVVSTMRDINTSSNRIADIVGVIDSIAFQTNILALNAAVEAARAGDQGRGFAVVASEVRSLAGRSASAAKEIKELISAGVDRVDRGSMLVSGAGQTMTEIVAAVRKVSDIISEISAATSEQSEGITQVNGSIGQLDQMTQQNAALVEQSAAAAGSLKDQARQLANLVSAFQLNQR